MLRRTAASLLLAAFLFGAACGSEEAARTDAQIRQEIATAFYANNIQTVTVAVESGVATLTGTASDQATVDRAVEIARATAGVTDVQNRVTLAESGPAPAVPDIDPAQPDTIAMARVQQRLIAEPELAGSKITPAVAGGVATLTGTVPTEAAKAAAERVARAVPGVTSVANQLQVVAAAPVVTRTDAQVEDDVNALLDRQYADMSLFVEVDGGKVSLSGAVPSQGRILQVSKAVSEVQGVKAVDTARLTVKGGEPEGQKIGAPTKP